MNIGDVIRVSRVWLMASLTPTWPPAAVTSRNASPRKSAILALEALLLCSWCWMLGDDVTIWWGFGRSSSDIWDSTGGWWWWWWLLLLGRWLLW